MTDKTDDTGKGPYRPGDAPKRPSATIDVEATEIGSERGGAGAHGDSRGDSRGGSRPEAKGGMGALPPPRPDLLARVWAGIGGALAAAWSLGLRLARNNTFLSHAAAGVAGAVLALAVTGLVWGLLGLLGGRQVGESADLTKRLAAVEKALPQRPALPADVATKLAGTETRLAKLEERVEAGQARLAADAKAIEARVPPPDVAERVAKLEAAIAPLSTEDTSGNAKVAVDQEVARLKSEAQSLRQGLEALKGSVEEQLKGAARAGDIAPVMGRLAALERELQGVLKTEGTRTAGSQQVLLALEVSNLKRALDRGDSFARELEAVRKAGVGTVDLAQLEAYSRTGFPTLGTLAREFRNVANAATDAENERPGASVIDRLMAGAWSVVRSRKVHYDADDASVEATLGRMESALRDGHIAEVLAQGQRLPPKAARAAQGWLRKLEARHAADRAIAEIEAGLKASLDAQRLAPPEAKR
jgi:hypothetical protein